MINERREALLRNFTISLDSEQISELIRKHITQLISDSNVDSDMIRIGDIKAMGACCNEDCECTMHGNIDNYKATVNLFFPPSREDI